MNRFILKKITSSKTRFDWFGIGRYVFVNGFIQSELTGIKNRFVCFGGFILTNRFVQVARTLIKIYFTPK